jgi:hypothetical protein
MGCDARINLFLDPGRIIDCQEAHTGREAEIKHKGYYRAPGNIQPTEITWFEGDRRTFRGMWRPCGDSTCTLPGGHPSRHSTEYGFQDLAQRSDTGQWEAAQPQVLNLGVPGKNFDHETAERLLAMYSDGDHFDVDRAKEIVFGSKGTRARGSEAEVYREPIPPMQFRAEAQPGSTDWSGRPVVQALYAMGHDLRVADPEDDEPHDQVLLTMHWMPLNGTSTQATVGVSAESYMRVGDVAVNVAFEQLMGTLVPKQTLLQAERVAQAMRRGPLGCELIGGSMDGTMVAIPTDGRGWPPPVYYFPVRSAHFMPMYREDDHKLIPAMTEEVLVMRRDWVNPNTLRWEYHPSV